MKVIITMHLKNICLKNASALRARWVKIFVFWLIFNKTFRKKFQWNLNQNTKDFLSRKCFGKCCWQNGSHLFQPSMICEEYFCTMCGYHIYIYFLFSVPVYVPVLDLLQYIWISPEHCHETPHCTANVWYPQSPQWKPNSLQGHGQNCQESVSVEEEKQW